MKLKIILPVGALGIMTALFSFFFTENIEIKNIEYFRFSYSNGVMADAYVVYSLNLSDEGYTASIKPCFVPDEKKLVFAVQAEFVRELERFLVENGVGKWNGFDKSNNLVLDGDSFGLEIRMQDGTSVSASGYMKWPKNYSTVESGIDAIFSRLTD